MGSVVRIVTGERNVRSGFGKRETETERAVSPPFPILSPGKFP